MIGVNFATHAQSHVVINLFVSLGKNIPDFLKSDTPGFLVSSQITPTLVS